MNLTLLALIALVTMPCLGSDTPDLALLTDAQRAEYDKYNNQSGILSEIQKQQEDFLQRCIEVNKVIAANEGVSLEEFIKQENAARAAALANTKQTAKQKTHTTSKSRKGPSTNALPSIPEES